MASPQPDKFTKWSNELLEAIYRYPFTANELRVMLFIGRNTYGYGEKTINLRVSKIARETNIGNKVINRVLKGLISSSCILYHQVEGKTGVTIGIQKDYEQWEVRKKKPKSTIKLRVKHHQVEGKKSSSTNYIKEKRNSLAEFEKFWSAYPIKVSKKAALKKWQVLIKQNQIPSLEIVLEAIQKQTNWRKNANGEFRPEWKHPATWLNQACWDDECKINKQESSSQPKEWKTPGWMKQLPSIGKDI